MGLINVVKHYLNKLFLKIFLFTFLKHEYKIVFKKFLFTLFNINTSFLIRYLFFKNFLKNFLLTFLKKHEYKFLIRYPF